MAGSSDIDTGLEPTELEEDWVLVPALEVEEDIVELSGIW